MNPRRAFGYILNEFLLLIGIQWVPNDEPITWIDWAGLVLIVGFVIQVVWEVVILIG